MKFCRSAVILVALLLAMLPAARICAQQGDFLSDEEESALRDAQDPGRRVEVYLELEQTRLERAEESRDNPAKVHTFLSQYISLNEEMKNWIQDQYDHHGDMRKGLRTLLDQGPQQLEAVKQIGLWPETAGSPYERDVRDAQDSMTDALDGGTKAFADQQKMFGELKREQKATAKESKDRIKEEKKRNKEEEKLRKKMQQQNKSNDSEN